MSKNYFQHELAVVESENIGKDTEYGHLLTFYLEQSLDQIATSAIIPSSKMMSLLVIMLPSNVEYIFGMLCE